MSAHSSGFISTPEALIHVTSFTPNVTREKRGAGVAEAMAAQGTQLVYLPPYSPDLNPIEQAFAKFTHQRPETIRGRTHHHRRRRKYAIGGLE
jgi:transposase